MSQIGLRTAVLKSQITHFFIVFISTEKERRDLTENLRKVTIMH